jgi:hypothetical protein
MGPKPDTDYSIERKDTNGNYTPENCIWATQTEQQRNKRNRCVITFQGKTQHLFDWAPQVGLGTEVIRKRLNRGWSVEDALTKPLDPRSAKRQQTKQQGGRYR